jgi:hypothetical protein
VSLWNTTVRSGALRLSFTKCYNYHVSHMNEHRLPKIVLFGELSTGYRNIGAPKKRYKDSLVCWQC